MKGRMEAPDFIRLVMDRLAARTPEDLAERLGWKRGSERKVYNWLSGANRPSFETAMELAEAAGLFAPEASTAVVRPGAPEDPGALDKLVAVAQEMELLAATILEVCEGDPPGRARATGQP